MQNDEWYFFTKQGKVQLWTEGNHCGMVLARDHVTACRFREWLKAKQDRAVSIAQVGTVEGETLEMQLNASLEHGANCAFVIRAVDDDGPTYEMLGPPVKG